MSKSSVKYISVFIPAFNGEQYLAECLEAVIGQELPDGYKLELLVTDSGSSDRTLEILSKYEKYLVLKNIPNKDFGHGKTRQKAAEEAKGEFILFLTQDATPSSYRWLINMVEPFFISDKVGCVFGRQIPRPYAPPTIKREVATVFGGITAPDSIALHKHRSLVDLQETNSLNTFFSDVNSAVRRKLLIEDIPFRDLPYAEDQALAEDMQNKGYLKAYSPLGAVWHSNEYTAREYFKRKFDEYTGLQDSLGYSMNPSKKSLFLGWIHPTLADLRFLKKDPDYSQRQKLKWLILILFYNINLQRGKYLAFKHYKNKGLRDKFSLEQNRK